ncbi:MAG TPA: hypothetical protein VJ953_06620 [Saprospiraceae bacterium]|nr:hypothetical protein [Saprospiraceae bacterium]
MFRFNKPEFGTDRLKDDLASELFMIRKYLKTSLSLLESEHKEQLASIEKEYQKALEIQKEEYKHLIESGEDPKVADSIASQVAGINHIRDPENYDRIEHFFESSKNILLKSALLLVYGVFENSLNQLCDFVRNYDSRKIAVRDIDEKNYLRRVKRYLSLVFDITANEKALNKLSSKVNSYQQVRNKIVHANAFFSKGDSFLEKLNKSNPHIKATYENELIILDERFVTDFMDLCIPYLEAFIPSVEAKLGKPTLTLELLWHISHNLYVSETSNAELKIEDDNLELNFDFKLKKSTRALSFKMSFTKGKFKFNPPDDLKSFTKEEVEKLEGFFNDLKKEEAAIIKILKSKTEILIDESTHLCIEIEQK